MAKSFSKLKSPKLGMLDILAVGKYKGCRVDSIVDMDYEYLIFMEKEKILYFTDNVLDEIKKRFSGYETVVDRHIPDTYEILMGFEEEDIPF